MEKQRNFNKINPFPKKDQQFSWRKPASYLSLVLLGAGIAFSGNYLFSQNLSSSQLPVVSTLR